LLFVLLLLLLKEVLEVFVVEVLFSFWFVPMSVKDEEDVELKSVFFLNASSGTNFSLYIHNENKNETIK
jgi:hypothetical protein